MNIEQMTRILEKIEQYHRIIIFRHKRPDGDAVGSTMGLWRILKLSFPEKEIYLQNSDFSTFVAFLGKEDEPIDDSLYADALGIVIDTATVDRISNPKYALCRELVKIDHHIPLQPYGDAEWVEEHRSSASEMIAEFYFTFRDRLKIDVPAATCIYTGMVTDSGRFRFRSVSGDTMRLAGMLIDIGIDLETLYAHIYMKEFGALKFKAHIYQKMKLTENGVVYIFVDKRMQERFGLSLEDASVCVSYLESIKDSLIWLAFIETDENIRVRLRSRFVTVNGLAEKYGGGGHDCAAGANVKDRKEMRRLLADADALLGQYKSENEGWL